MISEMATRCRNRKTVSKGSENIDDIVARINALNQQLIESGDSITSSPDFLEASKGSDES